MNFKINLAPLLAGVVNSAADAQLVAGKVMTYIQVAEQMGAALGLKGPDKLVQVKTLLLADLGQANAGLATIVAAGWTRVAGVISAAISIFNVIKWAFDAVAPVIEIAAPSAAPAIAAAQAAGAAISAVAAEATGE